MANLEQIAKLDEGVEGWNQWRGNQAITPDLSEVDFSGKDLSRADLRGADLRGVNFNGSDLSGASLREANLQGANLSGAKGGPQTEQLAGADLTGANLPEGLKKLYDSLQNVNNISESARKLFLAVLAACLYSWLTIATTTDLNLITNRASSPLPIIQTSIPIVGFYAVAPLLLLCVYFYFHFYLQKLWEELGSLPAILPDGRPLHTKIDPWLLNDLVRAHLPRLNVNRPFLSYFQLWISVLLAWWVVPITMFLFWGRYLPRHERAGTTLHVALLMISLTAALRLHRLGIATLRGTERKPLRWRGMLTSRVGCQTAAFTVAVGVLFGIVSWGAIMGVPSGRSEGHRTWVPRLMALVGYSPFADLWGAEVSQKKSTWSRNNKDLDSVAGAQLRGANLRYASAFKAFLAGARLIDADLRGASLIGADLQDADLVRADLQDADLIGADLRGANLDDARLNDVDLSGADLGGAKLITAQLIHADLGGANLTSARLNDANLSGADLGARLIDADLNGANLTSAHLSGADLSGARLIDADLGGADLTSADLTHCDFRGARNVNLESVKRAFNWEKAIYSDETLRALGLPPDHNAKIEKQQKKEEELQQKQNAGQTAPNPTPSKQ
jgi:uncharacterized protein YjbI with pentapeptide repeats